MPNYVYSTVYVMGYSENVEAFFQSFKHGENFIETLLPLPKEATKIITWDGSDTGYPVFTNLHEDGVDGYQMAVNLWGTKWTCLDKQGTPNHVFLGTYDFVAYEFTSAWSPFYPALEKISKMYPKLLFSVGSIEEQPAFAESQVYHDGLCLEKIDSYYEFNAPWGVDDDEYHDIYTFYWNDMKKTTFQNAYDLAFRYTDFIKSVSFVVENKKDLNSEPMTVFEY
jgi:hypothetical protein